MMAGSSSGLATSHSLVGVPHWLQQRILNGQNKDGLRAAVSELLDSTANLTEQRDQAIQLALETAEKNGALQKLLEDECTRSILVCNAMDAIADKTKADHEEAMAEAMTELDAARAELKRMRDDSTYAYHLATIANRRAAEAAASSSSGSNAKRQK
jgi:hypothetical protein